MSVAPDHDASGGKQAAGPAGAARAGGRGVWSGRGGARPAVPPLVMET